METGIVKIGSLILESGLVLDQVQLAYEWTGKNNEQVVLVNHSRMDNHKVVGTKDSPGWWNGLIGEDKSIDTNKFSVISFNVLGGCAGSTGPLSLSPKTGKLYQDTFPEVTIRDMVHAERRALSILGIDRLHTIIGEELGGMKTLEWGILYPTDMDLLIPIAVTPSTSKINSTLSQPRQKGIEFENCATVLRAMKTHDIGRGRGGINKSAEIIKAKTLILGFSQDLISPPRVIRGFSHLLSNASFGLINTVDSYEDALKEHSLWSALVKQFMEVVTCQQSKSLYSVSGL